MNTVAKQRKERCQEKLHVGWAGFKRVWTTTKSDVRKRAGQCKKCDKVLSKIDKDFMLKHT